MTTYARALFPGIAKIQSCVVSIGHGITPTGFRIITTPQPAHTVVPIGDLRLEYNDQSLVFPDCRTDEAYYRFDMAGQLIEVRLLDRRWRWQWGFFRDAERAGRISGEYNVRRPDGTIQKIDGGDPAKAVEDSERTPAQLATLLLEAAGELIAPGALDDLPADVRPYASWDDANPMAELQTLAELCNCRVVLGLDNLVRLKKVNVGRALPATAKTIAKAAAVDYFDSPDVVSLVSGWVRYQHDFELEGVALDVDGNRKLLDDLSYKPVNGWEYADILSNYALLDIDAAQNVAQQTVFKEYRIKVPFELPGWGTVTRREQLILLASQVYQENDEGIKVDRPAMVYGIYYRDNDAAPANSSNFTFIEYLPDDVVEARRSDDERVAQIVRTGFSVDTERWLVRFGQMVFLQDEGIGTGEYFWGPAKLRLRTTCYVRRMDDARIQRFEFPAAIRQVANPTVMDLIHDEIKPAVWAIYGAAFAVSELKTNEAELRPEIDRYLLDAVTTFGAAKVPEQAEYGGWLFDVDLDGAIQSITWSLSAKGDAPKTLIQRNQDTGNGGIPYRLRSEYAALRKVKRDAARIEWRQKREAEIARAGNLQ